MLAIAEDPPVPLPRRADRMPQQAVEQLANTPSEVASTEAADTPAVDPGPAAAAAEAVVADTTPQPVTLMAKITEDGNSLPDGVTWRVFETRTDASGDLVLAQRSDDATA